MINLPWQDLRNGRNVIKRKMQVVLILSKYVSLITSLIMSKWIEKTVREKVEGEFNFEGRVKVNCSRNLSVQVEVISARGHLPDSSW